MKFVKDERISYHKRYLRSVAEPRISEGMQLHPSTFKFYTWWHCFNATWTS